VLSRHLSIPLLALALLATGCGSVQDAGEPGAVGTEIGATRQISGNWKGRLHQEGQKPFQIAVDIGADSTAQVAYSGIKCGGEWSLEGVETSIPPLYIFREQINTGAGGACKGTGRVSVVPIQEQKPNEPAYNRLHYLFAGGGVTSRGLLHRTNPAGLRQVFKQAGVEAPPG